MYCGTHCSLQGLIDDQICDGEVGRWGKETARVQWREGELETLWRRQVWEKASRSVGEMLPSRASGVVCSSLEAWIGSAPKRATQPHDHQALSSTRVSEMENGSFSALGLFKRPPGSMVHRDHLDTSDLCYSWGNVVSVFCAATPGCVNARGPRGCLWDCWKSYRCP